MGGEGNRGVAALVDGNRSVAYRATSPAVAPATTTWVLDPSSLRWCTPLPDMHLECPVKMLRSLQKRELE